MTNSMWQQTEEMAKKHDQGGSLWLKLAGDGDKAVVVFLGEPAPARGGLRRRQVRRGRREDEGRGHEGLAARRAERRPYDSKEVKVLEQGVMFFKDLVRVREKYGLEKWAFEIQRHGAAKDPKTTYSILPEHQLSAEQQKAFQALPQHDLAKLYSGEGTAAARRVASRSTATTRRATRRATAPWLPTSRRGSSPRSKALPREATDKFLAKFGVQRIKDLPTSQVEKARAFVEQLQTESAAPAAAETEVDPSPERAARSHR